jgi:beta-glucosidase
MENGRQMESREGSMKLIPVISPRPGGRRARRTPPPAIIAASLSVLFPVAATALASPAAASTAQASTAQASTMAASMAPARTVAASPSCPWLNQSLPISQRVHLLLSKMTLANEITMVEGQGTSQPYVFYMAAQPSLCIPAMGLEDGPLGVGDGLTGVTQLPSGASLAATFDTSLARRYGAVIGQEEWGKGAAVNLGPTVNILRDPRWGRSFEAFTEDPFLNAGLAVSEIRGVQGQGEMSQVKHFAAYNQETNRNTPADDVIVSNRTLHEIYCRPSSRR